VSFASQYLTFSVGIIAIFMARYLGHHRTNPIDWKM
jgi:hypothetical protein